MVLLGQKLKPLTIGHLFLLERFECLPVEDVDQLIFAVLICSHDHEEVIPALENRWTNLRIRFWGWRLGKVDWLSKWELWQEYYERSTATPCVVQKSDNDIGGSATPFLQHVKVTLQSKLNYTPSEALSTPFSSAMWDYYTYHESEGNVDIADAASRKDMREWVDENHDELIREVIARREAVNGA